MNSQGYLYPITASLSLRNLSRVNTGLRSLYKPERAAKTLSNPKYLITVPRSRHWLLPPWILARQNPKWLPQLPRWQHRHPLRLLFFSRHFRYSPSPLGLRPMPQAVCRLRYPGPPLLCPLTDNEHWGTEQGRLWNSRTAISVSIPYSVSSLLSSCHAPCKISVSRTVSTVIPLNNGTIYQL